MKKHQILHIASWFPSEENPKSGSFVLDHVKGLQDHCENTVLHIQFSEHKKSTKTEFYDGIKVIRISLKPFLNRWRIKEFLAKKAIGQFLRKNVGQFEAINFYGAYPNGIGIGKFKQTYPQISFSITEVWSAYHYNFNLPENSKGKQRIASIFSHEIPLFVVSSALGQDLRNFTKQPNLSYTIIPNSIDADHFNFSIPEKKSGITFASINHWSKVKNPEVLIEAFADLLIEFPDSKLILGGSGELIPTMKNLVNQLNLTEAVQFLGNLTRQEVARTLAQANVYCQSSHYETFSIICVEALAVGRPVIATKIGGMVDFIHETNGILVPEPTKEAWLNAMKKMIHTYDQFNLEKISTEICNRYNSKTISTLYFNELVH